MPRPWDSMGAIEPADRPDASNARTAALRAIAGADVAAGRGTRANSGAVERRGAGRALRRRATRPVDAGARPLDAGTRPRKARAHPSVHRQSVRSRLVQQS